MLYKSASTRLTKFLKPEFTFVNEDFKNEYNAVIVLLYTFLITPSYPHYY